MIGKDLTARGKQILERTGFKVVTFNSNRRMQTRDWCDLFACRRGFVVVCEIKGVGDKLRPGQERFRDDVLAHVGPFFQYVLAKSEEDFLRIVKMAEEADRLTW